MAKLADANPALAVARRASLETAKLAQQILFKKFQYKVYKNEHCSPISKLQFMKNYPFAHNNLMLKRRGGLIYIKKKKWQIKITSKNLLYLKHLIGSWKMSSNLSSSNRFVYRLKVSPLLSF